MKIQELLKIHGKENVIVTLQLKPLHGNFFFKYTTSSDPDESIECVCVENRYSLEDNYKIEFQPLKKGYPNKSFYISDFNSLFNRGLIRLTVKIEDNV
jgi:hypothetical protein